jgi:hypothetical protein
MKACDMTSRDGLDRPIRPVSNTDLSNLYAAFVPTLAFLDATTAVVDEEKAELPCICDRRTFR